MPSKQIVTTGDFQSTQESPLADNGTSSANEVQNHRNLRKIYFNFITQPEQVLLIPYSMLNKVIFIWVKKSYQRRQQNLKEKKRKTFAL